VRHISSLVHWLRQAPGPIPATQSRRDRGPGPRVAGWLGVSLLALLVAGGWGCDRPATDDAPAAAPAGLVPSPASRTQGHAQLLLSPTSPQIGHGTAQVFVMRSMQDDGHVRDVTAHSRFTVTRDSGERVGDAPDGIVALAEPGRYLVTAEFDGGRISTPIVVTAAAVRSVTVTPGSPKVAKGLTQQFKAVATMTDGTTQDVTAVASWSVKDTSGTAVATVNSAGLASAKNVGKARISARYNLTSGSTTMEVTPAAIKTLSIAPQNPSIAKGTSQGFTATGQFTDGTVQDLTTQVDWAVRDVMGSGIASIDATGTAVGDAVGQAAVSAEFEGQISETTLTVTAAAVVSLSISPLTPSIAKGLSQQFKATARMSDGSSQDVSAVASWLALDITGSGVASVDASGLAKANAVGLANIGCAYRGFAATTTLEVKPALLVSVAMNPTTASIAKGRKQSFQLIGTYSDGSKVNVSSSALWQVADVTGTDVASVDGSGQALGKNVGTARISAEHMGKSASAALTVGPAEVNAVTLLPGNVRIAVGATQAYKLLGFLTDGTTRDLTSMTTWKISDIPPATGVATITASGVATGKAVGTATVTADYDSLRATVTLAVGPGSPISSVCSSGGWCWRNPLPQGGYLPSVWAADASNAWTVGDQGLILRWNGTSWDQVTSGTTQNLLAVWGLDRNNIWAVGVGGVIVKWNGTSWAVQSSGTTQSLSAVWGWDASNVWAAGANGTILKWDGSAWKMQPSGTPAYLRGLFGTSASSVWAVGQSGTILKWDGMTWTPQSAGGSPAPYLRAIWGTDDKNLWAVGDMSVIAPVAMILHWDGMKWNTDPSFPLLLAGRLRGIWGSDANNIVAVGDNGAVAQWNGSGWASRASVSSSNLNGVSGSGTGSVWFVGDSGTIMKWSFGGGPLPYSSGSLTGITSSWGSDANNIWFVGYSGQILYWNGTRLQAQPSGTTQSLLEVWGTDARNVWAMGSAGTLLHWDGSTWSPVSSGTTQLLDGAFGTSANNVWFVGSSGTILRWDGTAVSPVASPVTSSLTSIWGPSANDLWATSYTGILLHWDGTSWTQQASGITADLKRVFGTSSSNIWVVGQGGQILRWNGTSWTAQTSGTTQNLYTVWASSPSSAWAAGDNGTLLQWNGTAWTPRASGTSTTLYSLWGSSASNVWVAGTIGTILQYAP